MTVLLSLLSIVLAVLGIADAGYMTYSKYAGIVPPCRPGFHCATVLESPWAYIGPFPLALYGLLFYSAVFILSILFYLQYDLRPLVKKLLKPVEKYRLANWLGERTTQEWLFGATIFGFFFSLYLVAIMGVIIKAWCFYCLISACTCFSLFIVNLLLWKFAKK